MKRALLALAAVTLSLSAAGCYTTSVAISVPNLSVAPQRPRGVTWKPVDIRRESADRYTMTGRSRDNLRDNLADIARNQEQWNAYGDYYEPRQPRK